MNSWMKSYYLLHNRFNRLLNTYVVNGIVQTCGHSEWEECECDGRIYKGKHLRDAYRSKGLDVEDHVQ